MTERSLYHWLAAGFGSGWLPKAPGTWGSVACLLPAWLIVEMSGANGLLIASAIVTVLGCLVCRAVLPRLEDKDPGWIVIDEWAGQWLCLALIIPFAGTGFITFLAAFIAFRAFDILKPWPVSAVEKPGPAWWSIMADDLVAGLLGFATLLATHLLVSLP